MADILSKENLFDPTLVTDLFSKVKGQSALAALSAQNPIPFNGQKEFIFTMDDEVDLVAENGKKTRGSVKLDPVTIMPLKVEYGARISDEFLFASDEAKIEILTSFNDGFAKKVARGLDIMAFHGVNPRSKTASSLIGANHFDNGIAVVETAAGKSVDDLVEEAIAKVQEMDYDVSGMAMAPSFRSDLSKLTVADGRKLYPELAWGSAPGTINGLSVQVNNTIAFNNSADLAIVGDFASAFKWGYSNQIPLEIIKYGDPDNSGMDLKGYNQIYIRAEVYLGWGILDKSAFSVIRTASE
jgi:HK97 family phage major capsid protein